MAGNYRVIEISVVVGCEVEVIEVELSMVVADSVLVGEVDTRLVSRK